MVRRAGKSLWRWTPLVTALVVMGALSAVLMLPTVQHSTESVRVTPLPGFVPSAVDALVAVVNGMRWISPFIAVAGVIAFLSFALAGRTSGRARTLNRLSRIEYAGVDHVAHGRQSRWPITRLVRGFVKGTGLAVLAVLLVGSTSGIEHEVVNGPLRPVNALTDLLNTGDVSYVFQSPAITFMDDSSIPADQIALLVTASPAAVVPFGKHLFNLNDKSALELSVPDELYERVAGEPVPLSCSAATIVVDDTVGAAVGDYVTLNGVRLRVATVEDGIAQMNRSVAILADSTVRECVEANTTTAYFGAVVASTDIAQIRETLHTAGVDGVAVSGADFLEHNRDFWRANATPLLLQLILYIALFSGFAAAGERQSALQRNSREIGMLSATGVDFGTLQAIERRRALRTTLKATLLAAPLMVPVAAAFNASELGVHIGVGLTEVTVGFSLTVIAMLLASQRALTQFRKSLDLPLAVKG